ncbi:flagellin [Candidatus Phycosocius spiralis]|uniref:Flagellin n=1 Tax=Candidatus Phycosocius spiralis TaxID=2815099 RepID=A0ABQ4PTS8_9PROT|nr:flagellin [Candidatus Phycosocius spiralis]GIU66366.1 flagellin [Candidatus Phycosocius spiralis]
MSNSVHTNVGAMVALQNLNTTSRDLNVAQNRISTGFKVATAKDNGATYNIAQNQRSENLAYDAVSEGLYRAKSIADVALAAGTALSDLFTSMRQHALAASDTSISAVSRKAYDDDFKALRDQVPSIIANAVFDGANILGGGSDLEFLANSTASEKITLPTLDLRLATGAGTTPAVPAADVYVGATSDLSTAALAATSRDQVVASLNYINSELARLGATAKRIDNHAIFVSKLQDAITSGIGNMVDADLAKESARLQSLQVKQQLGTQALSIANQAPQGILSLFRN